MATSPATPSCASPPSGQAIATFGLAVNRRFQRNGQWEEQTVFFNVTCWGQMGENASQSLPKGARVVVTGRLEQRSWETQDGEKRSTIEVIADEIGPSLRWATCEITKNDRREPGETAVARPVGQRRARGWAVLRRRGTVLMAKKAPRTKNKDNARRSKKKTSVLVQESVDYIDYKDINLLRRFMSDRAKIRARRVTGNDAQQQREVARAIKNAREMALLPYTNRVTTQRTSRDRGPGGPGRADGPPPRPAGPPPLSGGDGVARCRPPSSTSRAARPTSLLDDGRRGR